MQKTRMITLTTDKGIFNNTVFSLNFRKSVITKQEIIDVVAQYYPKYLEKIKLQFDLRKDHQAIDISVFYNQDQNDFLGYFGPFVISTDVIFID